MRVFLAAPFAAFFGPLATVADADAADLRSVLVTLEEALQSAGHSVFLAHRRENFGETMWPAEMCTPFDLMEMLRADAVVAIPGESYGVHVELGWASAQRKPVILLLEEGQRMTTPLVPGLTAVTRCAIVTAPRGLAPLQDVCARVLAELSAIVPATPSCRLAVIANDDQKAPALLADLVPRLRALGFVDEIHHFGCERDGILCDRSFAIDLRRDFVTTELSRHVSAYCGVFVIGDLPHAGADGRVYAVSRLEEAIEGFRQRACAHAHTVAARRRSASLH